MSKTSPIATRVAGLAPISYFWYLAKYRNIGKHDIFFVARAPDETRVFTA
jgi:hypothetical protein